MRPTGKLHLGNYMGALVNWVKLQDEYECYFFIADWHALTTDYADPSRLKLNTLDVALDWLAAGLDPEKSTIFIQSHVPQHAELHLLFSMITPLGWLERVPTYKEQQENLTGKDLTTYGFLGYPLLQAADILLYQPQYVPVGQDQVAHVELTREVARRFNSMYKTSVFPEPDALLTPSPKLPGTDGRKMSKSYGNTIGLTEDPKSVALKVEGMSTNGQRPRQSDTGDPNQCPVGDLHKLFSSAMVIVETQAACRTATISCKDCKAIAAKSTSDHVEPIYARRQELKANEKEVWDRLKEGSARASVDAEKSLNSAKKLVGLSREYDGEIVSKVDLDRIRLAKEVRDYWLQISLPKDIPLKEKSAQDFASQERFLEEPLLTASKKRVLVHAADPTSDATYLEIPAKSYEVWVLLSLSLKHEDYEPGINPITDFILPQKVFSQPFAQAKKSLKKDEKIPVSLRQNGERFLIQIHDSEPIDITELRGNYEPLR
jgi:tryptophanyl-tRNA synthetase